MAQGDKSAIYRALKRTGFQFAKHYREYTTAELQRLWDTHAQERGIPAEQGPEMPAPALPQHRDDVTEIREQLASVAQTVANLAQLVTTQQRREERATAPLAAAGAALGADPSPAPARPAPALDPNEHAGVTLNTHAGGEVLEVDEFGNQWFQKEVNKPAFPKPRGRRVLRYDDPGVRPETIKVGEYVETFEVSGDPRNARPSEIKVTLPSYQTGIYKPPNMPFRVHTYQGARGFSLQDVEAYYGGADLVPDTIKRCYVSTDLCYDIQSTIRTIENEYRERVLRAGKGL